MQGSTVGHSTQAPDRRQFPQPVAELRLDVPVTTAGTQRIVMLQPCESAPLDSPRLSAPLSPRLGSAGGEVDEYEWDPVITECSGPSARFSPELEFLHREGFWSADPREPEGMVFVRQSEGRVSSEGLPLVSVGFAQCSTFLFRNDEGESLMFHHDSTARSGWGDKYAAIGGVPTSPSTPVRGLMGRRSPLDDFIARGKGIRMVLIESKRAGDRRELFDEFRSRGVEVLPPLLLETRHHGEPTDEAEWNVAYRPHSDELMVHMKDGKETRVMHWAGVLSLPVDGSSPVPLLRRRPPEDGDIVDRLPHYRALLADSSAPLPARAREVLRLCVEAIELRNEAPKAGVNRLKELFTSPGIPLHVSELLAKADLHERGSLALKGLTYLVEHTLKTRTTETLVPFDSDSESESDVDTYPDTDADNTDADVDLASAPLPAQQTAQHPPHDLAPDAAADGAHG